tara:strand:+ start:97 stop:690 length:594 start_codon:yes stop_codon:yes gene_type:complete
VTSEAFVYRWDDSLTGKIYIGYHKGSEFDGYICSGKYMLEKYKKRPNDFSRTILMKGNCRDCYEYEQLKIAKIFLLKIPTYNKALGGTWKIDAEVMAKLSASRTGEKNHNWGKSFSYETRKKIALSRLGKPFNVGKDNPMYGKKQSPNHYKWIQENVCVAIKTELGEFPSVTMAAKAHGVAQPTMSGWLRKGKAIRL